MSARNTDPETSHEAAEAFCEVAATVDCRIIALARAAGARGVTQSEVVDALPEYKPGSITPRFARLVRRGLLVRVCIGTSKPTKHCPFGRPRYVTRVDKTTRCRVLVHWVPEFAPAPKENGPNSAPISVAPTERTQHDFDRTIAADTSPNL